MLFWEYDKNKEDILSTVNSKLDSYDGDLEDIKNAVGIFCDKNNIPKDKKKSTFWIC